jgi:hypothetical protein
MYKVIILVMLVTGLSVSHACIKTAEIQAQEAATSSCSFQDGKSDVATLESFVFVGIEKKSQNQYVGKFGFFCSNQKGGFGEVRLTYAGDFEDDYKNNTVDESKCMGGEASMSTADGIKF